MSPKDRSDRGGRAFRRPALALLVLLSCLAAPALRAQELSVPERALFQAAEQDDAELAAFALERGARVGVVAPSGERPIHVAAWNGSLQVLRLLLDKGADPAAATPDDSLTPLHQAASAGQTEAIRLLLAAGAPTEAREGRYGNTPLLMAARGAKRGAVAVLLEGGADVEVRDERKGNTALITAAFDPLRLSVLGELLARGAAVDGAADDGLTPLMAAASRGNQGAVQLLLEAGALVAAAQEAGLTALHFSAISGETAILRTLLAAGADPETGAKDGNTALGAAAAATQVDTVLALLRAGADPNRPSRGGLPPLHRAVRGGSEGAALALLANGADPNAVDREKGNSALMLAANLGRIDLVRILLSQGARVDLVAKDGWTALEAARMIGDDETMALLRAAGAEK